MKAGQDMKAGQGMKAGQNMVVDTLYWLKMLGILWCQIKSCRNGSNYIIYVKAKSTRFEA